MAALLVAVEYARRAAALDGDRQDPLDLLRQAQVARLGDAPGGLARIDAGGEQRFAGVDVADPDHHRVVHDERLDRHAPPARQLEQTLAGESVGQRFRAEVAQQLVFQWRQAPEHGAEAPRIGVAQGHARGQLDVDVLVATGRGAALHQPQAAGHAQVADQRTGLGAQQQVLGAALDADDALSGQAHVQVFGNRPAQAPLAHDHALDALAFEVGGDAPAGGFDFG